MNIYDFFNSPDVAEYCQSIGKTFNALESAVMIVQSYSRTLSEKHAAFETIIAEYPDMEIPKALNHRRIESFHKMLESILAYEERKLEKLLTPEAGAVYQASIEYKDNSSAESEGLFTSYERALSDALECFKQNERVLELTIRKKYPDSKNWIGARVSLSGEVMEVRQTGVLAMEDDDEEVGLLGCGPGIWEASCYIDVPVPFKRGDLVEDVFGNSYGKVYVLKGICRDDPKRHGRMLSDGGLIDMTASIFYERGGSVLCECMHFYPNLQYCRRELEGEKRILKYLSQFMKDEICACTLLNFRKNISPDNTAKT